jgi:hypothetical protein
MVVVDSGQPGIDEAVVVGQPMLTLANGSKPVHTVALWTT